MLRRPLVLFCMIGYHILRLFGVYDNCKVLDSLSPLLIIISLEPLSFIVDKTSKSYHLSISSTELLIIWDAAYLRIPYMQRHVVTSLKLYSYCLAVRQNFNPIHCNGKLFQQYGCICKNRSILIGLSLHATISVFLTC